MDLLFLFPIIESALLFCYIPALYLFRKNRHIHPIKGRKPTIVLGVSYVILLGGLCFIFRFSFWDSYPCLIYFLQLGTLAIICFTCGSYRLTGLLFSFEITDDLLRLENCQKSGQNWSPGWFTRCRYFATRKFWTIILIIAIVFFWGGLLALMAPYPSFRTLQPHCEKGPLFGGYALVCLFTGIFALYLFTLAIRLRQRDDNHLKIKQEFLLISISFIPAIVALIVALSVNDSFAFDITFVCFYLFPCHVLFVVSIIYPYWASLKELKAMTNHEENLSLMNFLQSPEGCRLFQDYLQTERSAENLQFFLEAKDYERRNPENQKEMIAHAKKIFELYISEKALFRVNISGRMRKLIEEQFNPNEISDLQIFSNAKNEILALMEQDSYLRFQRTPQFIKFMESYKSNSRYGKESNSRYGKESNSRYGKESNSRYNGKENNSRSGRVSKSTKLLSSASSKDLLSSSAQSIEGSVILDMDVMTVV